MSFERPVFVSWLGTTMFLTNEANFGTFGLIATWPTGTEIIFDYFVSGSKLDEDGRAQLQQLEQIAIDRGEPFRSLFPSDELQNRMQDLGYTGITDVGPEETYQRFFASRADGLVPSPQAHFMKATV